LGRISRGREPQQTTTAIGERVTEQSDGDAEEQVPKSELAENSWFELKFIRLPAALSPQVGFSWPLQFVENHRRSGSTNKLPN
jgi:hypothetical protein